MLRLKCKNKYYLFSALMLLLIVRSCSVYFKNSQNHSGLKKESKASIDEDNSPVARQDPSLKNMNEPEIGSNREVKRSTSRQLKDADYIEIAIKVLKREKMNIPEVKPVVDDSGKYIRVTWPVIRPEKTDGSHPPGSDYYYQILFTAIPQAFKCES